VVLISARTNLKKVREANTRDVKILEVLDKQIQQITDTNKLLSDFITDETLRLKFLQEPLDTVKKYLEGLAKFLAENQPDLIDMDELADKVHYVANATKNLRGRLPGNRFTAKNDVAKPYAIQLAGPVGLAKMDFSNGPMHVDAQDNEADIGSVQVLAAFSGDPKIIERMQEKALMRAAQAAQEEAQKAARGTQSSKKPT
jgi:hypothetical protein